MHNKMIVFLLIITIKSFGAPFFYHELVLSNSKYSISIDSNQKLFGSIDTFCANHHYYYFSVLKNPSDFTIILSIIKNTASREGDTLQIAYYNALNQDTLPCDSFVATNGGINKQNLLDDTTKILWGYPPPPLFKTKSYNQALRIADQHIYLLLKNDNDSTSATLTKGRFPYTGCIQGQKTSIPLNDFATLQIASLSTLQAIAVNGVHLILFDVFGKKLFDSKRENFSDVRLSGKVVLYKIESSTIPPVWGKIIAP